MADEQIMRQELGVTLQIGSLIYWWFCLLLTRSFDCFSHSSDFRQTMISTFLWSERIKIYKLESQQVKPSLIRPAANPSATMLLLFFEYSTEIVHICILWIGFLSKQKVMRKKCSCFLSDEHFHLIFLQLTVLDLVNVAHVLYCLLGCVQLLSVVLLGYSF